ncbi:putative ribonuclease H protein [Citrus sinensis]|uniref:Ribonuclease H protein n=1 Tax=Citrus sinensis TaxID=2711 RepID=A0ACB8KKG7_CITSI|nr:putative ribonuclease H protein [Citrus sinensis]
MMNRALKLAWGLISSPNSFWVQVIVSKYGVDIHNPPLMLPTRYGSHLWKSLGNVWSEVLASRRWCLGDGQSVWFWWDLWVTRDVPLAAYTINNLPSNILNGKVADFFLPSNIILQIAALHPPSPDKGTDSLFWAHSKFGRFTTHSAYLAFSNDTPMHDDRLWRTVWSWKGPQSVRIFLWQVFHDRLKTKAELVRRHIPVSTSCYRCGAVTEDAMHVLRDCALQFFNSRLQEWLRTNVGIVGRLGSVSNWAIFFSIALWRLWFWRNQFIFNQVSMDPNVVLMDVFMRTAEMHKIHTHPLTTGYTRGISTAGGLIRDHMGRWLSGFGMMIGSCSITVAELWGLYQGLHLAWNSGIRKLKVEIDSRCVLQLVTKPTLEINHYAPLIQAIKDYLKMD